MGQRKKRFVALVCAVSVIALSGCGDDLTQQVCIPGVEELAQPIGGYHTGPQDDQPGDNIGEIVLPGGTVPIPAILHCRNRDSPGLRIL